MTQVPAHSHTVVRDSIRLHHLEWGERGRPAVVLVHGSRLHAHVWNDFCRRSADRYHLIAVDQRGHGDSGWAPEDGYRVEEFCRDLEAVVEARGIDRFTLIGHSLGGRVSMLYAHRHPERLERLVLVDITAGQPSVPASVDLSREPGADPSETAPPREFDSHASATDYLSGLLARAPRHMVEESVVHGMRLTESGRYTWKYDPVLFRPRRSPVAGVDFWNLVSGIATPTLLQYGSESRIVTPELAARMAAAMPRCAVERIEGAGHALFTDRPDAFAASVARFLAA